MTNILQMADDVCTSELDLAVNHQIYNNGVRMAQRRQRQERDMSNFELSKRVKPRSRDLPNLLGAYPPSHWLRNHSVQLRKPWQIR